MKNLYSVVLIVVIFGISLVVLSFTSCDQDCPDCPTCPPCPTATPTPSPSPTPSPTPTPSSTTPPPTNIGTIYIDEPPIDIAIWDNGNLEDGDRVTVKLNGSTLWSDYSLQFDKSWKYDRTVSSGTNEITVYAHNEGDSPPNTAAIQVTEDDGTTTTKSWSLDEGQTGTVYVEY